MLQPSNLHAYQKKAILHQLYHPESMLWLGMSLGKTVITLSSIEHRMRAGQVSKVLVFAPIRVIYGVWEREARKWSHTQHLRFSIIHGTEKVRTAAMFTNADIYLCNYENMAWLSNMMVHYFISQGKPLPFQMCVYDEVSRVKNSESVRMKGALHNVERPDGRVVRERKFVGWRDIIPHIPIKTGLTGTPASNGYPDLFGQYLAIDNGVRLGEYITHFRNTYCARGFTGFGYVAHEMGKAHIHQKISDITLEMATEDYINLPPIMFNDIEVDLKPKNRDKYESLENEMFAKLDDGTEIEVFNRAALSNKCLQFSNGATYLEPGEPEWIKIHDEKFQALDSIIEEAGGNPVFVSYCFKFDKEQIMTRYKKLNPVCINDVPLDKLLGMIDDWRNGKIKLLIGHPASIGHGVDGLQDNGDTIVMFGLNWSLELYDQVIARFMRQGRKIPLTVHRILCRDTTDMAVKYSLESKRTDENGLRAAINRYRAEKGK